MKKTAVPAVIAVLIAVLAFYLLERRGRTPQPSTAPLSTQGSQGRQSVSTETGVGQNSAAQPQAGASNQTVWPKTPSTSDVARALELARAKSVRIRPGEVLAAVNGVPITLKDLMAIDPSDTQEHSVSDDAYKYLLNRAIERELAFQAARQQGVQLSPEQQARLANIEKSIRDTEEAQANNVLARLNSPTSVDAQVEWEKRDAAGLLTQQALLDRAGGPPLEVTEDQVQQDYQQNIEKYGTLPTDPAQRDTTWQQIDSQIRHELMYSNLEKRQKALKEYMDGLKSAAQIQTMNVKDQAASASQ